MKGPMEEGQTFPITMKLRYSLGLQALMHGDWQLAWWMLSGVKAHGTVTKVEVLRRAVPPRRLRPTFWWIAAVGCLGTIHWFSMRWALEQFGWWGLPTVPAGWLVAIYVAKGGVR